MPNPKRRHSSSRRGKRRSHDALESKMLIICPTCKAGALPHRVCNKCGYYKGRQIIVVNTDNNS